MQLCSYVVPHQSDTQIGLVRGAEIVSVSAALPGVLAAHQPMIDLIGRWDELLPQLETLLASSEADTYLNDVRLLAPVPRPGKLLAIGLNYLDHIQEKIVGESRSVPEHQVWFTKLGNAINGPFDPIVLPSISTMTDYEGELVAVIGRRCKNVTPDQASEMVFGYCVGNDVSVRDWQKRTSQWTLGKSFDTHAPFGPWLTTADQVGDPHALNLKCWVNGELRQQCNTRQMIHDIWEQVAVLSQAMTLEPGDVIFTGTCRGVGAAFDPPRFLRDGDYVKVEADGLGSIVAKCVAEG